MVQNLQGILGDANLPRATLGSCNLFQLPEFSFPWFVSLPLIWETGLESSLIFFFPKVFPTAHLTPATT